MSVGFSVAVQTNKILCTIVLLNTSLTSLLSDSSSDVCEQKLRGSGVKISRWGPKAPRTQIPKGCHSADSPGDPVWWPHRATSSPSSLSDPSVLCSALLWTHSQMPMVLIPYLEADSPLLPSWVLSQISLRCDSPLLYIHSLAGCHWI